MVSTPRERNSSRESSFSALEFWKELGAAATDVMTFSSIVP
jgi:hypothetical protein